MNNDTIPLHVLHPAIQEVIKARYSYLEPEGVKVLLTKYTALVKWNGEVVVPNGYRAEGDCIHELCAVVSAIARIQPIVHQ